MKHPSTRWLGCVVLLFVGGCSSPAMQSAAQTARAAKSYDRLHLAMSRGDMDELVAASKNIAHFANKSEEAMFLNSIGYTLADRGNLRSEFEAAEKLTRRAVELSDENVKQAQREK